MSNVRNSLGQIWCLQPIEDGLVVVSGARGNDGFPCEHAAVGGVLAVGGTKCRRRGMCCKVGTTRYLSTCVAVSEWVALEIVISENLLHSLLGVYVACISA